jgi:hypothetical protein
MAQETWLVVAVGAGFLLLGIAASPLGWVAMLHRRAAARLEGERHAREMGEQLRGLRVRVERCEVLLRASREEGAASELLAASSVAIGSHPPGPIARRRSGRGTAAADAVAEPRLISVPRLAAAQDRQAAQGALGQRYAAIWELAESGASPDAIARATGQPIGQIELILGLRRQMDAGRTSIPHASHE